jgi:hypothetical protein
MKYAKGWTIRKVWGLSGEKRKKNLQRKTNKKSCKEEGKENSSFKIPQKKLCMLKIPSPVTLISGGQALNEAMHAY